MQEDELIARFECLERDNRRWKTASIVALVVLLAMLLVGFKTADFSQPDLVRAHSVEAQSFVLRDAGGQIRARMAVAEDGARLTFFDEQGKVVSSLPLRAEMRPAR